MADFESDAYYGTDEEAAEPRRPGMGVADVITLLAGLATLLVSAYVLTDGALWLPPFDLRWVLAGGAVLVGALMLAASLRGSRKDVSRSSS